MLTVLRQRKFGILWTAGFISLLGDWVLYAVFPFYIARATGSALATGGMALVELLPNLVLGTVMGVLIDRWNPRKIMIAADLLRVLALIPLFLVHSAGLLWLVYIVAFTESSISVFFGPAKAVLLRQVVINEDLMTANSFAPCCPVDIWTGGHLRCRPDRQYTNYPATRSRSSIFRACYKY